MSRWWIFSLVALVLAGCDSRVEKFESNEVFALSLARSRSVPTEAARRDVSSVIGELFGSPDQPRWPAELLAGEDRRSLVDSERLTQAAGPVFSERDGRRGGLYREHCVPCHGVSGSGTGPTSRFQNPYPRDFRHGVFKWKSTERAAKPTRADLVRVLRRGIPGTAMPSFTLVKPDDLETLVDYLIYLAVRGEVERELLAVAVDELGYEEGAPEASWRLVAGAELTGRSSPSEGGEVVVEIVNEVVGSWVDAEESVAEVPPSTLEQASAERGREIFHGPIANCTGCHGPSGDGQVATLDFDDWTKEFSTGIGLTPTDREAMHPMREAGALPPRPIYPRRLQAGAFRGGGDPESLFRRITQGIAGTPMPAVEWTEQPSGKGLTTEQIWDLVAFVLSLNDAPSSAAL